MITRENALKLINSNDPSGKPLVFDLEAYSWNERTKSGGKLLKLTNCSRTGHISNMKVNRTINVRQVGSSYHPVNIHIDLIYKVNGKKVVW